MRASLLASAATATLKGRRLSKAVSQAVRSPRAITARGVHEQRAQVSIASLGNAQLPDTPAAAGLPGYQAQPGRKFSAGFEAARITHRRHRRGGRQYSNAGNGGNDLTMRILTQHFTQPPINDRNMLLKVLHTPPLTQSKDPYESGRQQFHFMPKSAKVGEPTNARYRRLPSPL
jgi:hypothetical protein